ncbi:hypothetical protein PR048_010820 [Dryococelus australis]|uniref:PiggyBac transposable element-derived protein domain-containing protein n=1 Tax=Dryococelus australis TaxID=614101 RepID=A0ABQ9I3R6_9NEOP|nr:hypothetical protein PR048_010820 [Dryococelus australis]
MLDEILQRTNEKIQSVQSRWSEDMRYLVTEMDMVELKATLVAGLVETFFVRLKRYLFLLIVTRFNNALDRENSRENVPLAAVYCVFNKLVKNSPASFTVGSYVCIDKMLVGFTGNYKFRMYMASKPKNYINAGEESGGLELDEEIKQFFKPIQAVLRHTAPLCGSNRNITADNWFTSVEVVQILKNSKGLTYADMLRKNKSEIPSQFQSCRTRTVGSSLYGYTKDITLLSHAPKRNK